MVYHAIGVEIWWIFPINLSPNTHKYFSMNSTTTGTAKQIFFVTNQSWAILASNSIHNIINVWNNNVKAVFPVNMRRKLQKKS